MTGDVGVYNAEVVKEYFPPFPRGLAGKYYEEGLQYFSTFDGFGDCEILSVEDKFELNIRGNRFVGIADLVLRDKNSGAISVIDHKSKSMPSLKKKLFENTRQLYPYAFSVKERFGVYPDLLRFNMFRYNTFIDEPFSMERYEETLDWIERTIQAIKAEREWRVSSSGYFCRFICSGRRTEVRPPSDTSAKVVTLSSSSTTLLRFTSFSQCRRSGAGYFRS